VDPDNELLTTDNELLTTDNELLTTDNEGAAYDSYVRNLKSENHFLNKFANACLASVGAVDEDVSRSTTARGAKSSQMFLAFLLTIRLRIVLLHSKRAPGSKWLHWRQLCNSARQLAQVVSKSITPGALAPQAEHLTTSPNAIIFGERGAS
jgi:hypothetical protein